MERTLILPPDLTIYKCGLKAGDKVVYRGDRLDGKRKYNSTVDIPNGSVLTVIEMCDSYRDDYPEDAVDVKMADKGFFIGGQGTVDARLLEFVHPKYDYEDDPQYFAFRKRLWEEPDDFDTRAVMADWLEERGDWRALGQRWMASKGRLPKPAGDDSDLRFTWSMIQNDMPGDIKLVQRSRLPVLIWRRLVWFDHVSDQMERHYRETKGYATVESAEESLCQALIEKERGDPMPVSPRPYRIK